jgi:tRNA-specific 2-thiouridylase
MANAKAIADHLGIPHYAMDEREPFRRQVIEYFVAEYAAGRTPNPCAKCNSRVRFGSLMRWAQRLGADAIATGHYARLFGPDRRLGRAADLEKDQSYVLAEVDARLLSRCLFPLGPLTKGQVRDLAARIGIDGLVSDESQDICFVPGEGYRDFLKERLGEQPGDVVDESGNVIGRHTGTYNYTIGQRRGLGQGGGETLYVAAVDAERRRVLALGEAAARKTVIRFRVSTRHQKTQLGAVRVQFRSSGGAVTGRMIAEDAVALDEPMLGVAPGQTVVVYGGDEVLIAGTIT